MSGHDDDRQLVERARHDPDAFGELYRRHVDAIFAFAMRRTGSRATAEDVTAATFERALTKLDRFAWRDSGFRPWLYRLAANEVADHHRRRARHRSPRNQVVLGRFHQPTAAAADTDVGAADDRARVRLALDGLSRRHTRILTLTYFTDLDRDAVADAVGLSARSYAVALHRAKAALRRALEDDDR